MNGYKAGVEEAGGTFLSDEVQYADATADRATTAMEAIMQTHPEGIAIICANNDDMAMAAAVQRRAMTHIRTPSSSASMVTALLVKQSWTVR